MPTEERSPTEGVVCEVRIAASPETVFPFFTDPELIVRWMGEEALLNPQPGGALRLRLAGDHVVCGKYLELQAPERVVFTWGWEHEETLVPPGSSTVEVELIPETDGTLVRLTHRELPEPARDGHRKGWTHYLGRIEIAAAGGDPGPDPGMGGEEP